MAIRRGGDKGSGDARCCLDARSGLVASPTLTSLYWGSNFFMASGESYTSPKPVVLPPPYCVRRPKTLTWSLVALYMPASFSRSSSLAMLARLGWRMSLGGSQHLSLAGIPQSVPWPSKARGSIAV